MMKKVLRNIVFLGSFLPCMRADLREDLLLVLDLRHFAASSEETKQRAYYFFSQALEKHVSDINTVFCDGRTPLGVAIAHYDRDISKGLIGKGADVNGYDAHGKLPLYYALMNGDEQSVRMLLYHKSATIPYQNPTACTGRDIAELLVLKNNRKHSCFIRDFAKALLTVLIEELKIDCNQLSGDAPIGVATLYSDHESMELLIKTGINVNVMDQEGYYPLHYAVSNRDDIGTRLLLDAGANPLLHCQEAQTDVAGKSSLGKTPFSLNYSHMQTDVTSKNLKIYTLFIEQIMKLYGFAGSEPAAGKI